MGGTRIGRWSTSSSRAIWIPTRPSPASSSMNAEGTAAFSTDPEIAGKKYDSSPYYQQAMKGSPYSSDLQVSAETGKSTIYYSAPIKDNGKTIGAAVARGD